MTPASTDAGGNDEPTAANGGPSEHQSREGDMGNVAGQVHSVEAVVQTLRTANVGKMAALSAIAHAVAVNAGAARVQEYIEAFRHAHETGNLAEARGLALSISAATGTMQRAAMDLDNALDREMTHARAVA